MTLRIYEQTSPGVYEAFSVDQAQTNPISTVHNGRNGDIFEMKLYVGRVVGSTHTYERIQVKPVSRTEANDIDPTGENPTGWGVKLMVDEGHDPTEAEWDATDYGVAIDIDDIDGDEKLPFWYRIESPRGIRVSNKHNIALLIVFTENS